MKKVLFLFIIILLTGCGNEKITCSLNGSISSKFVINSTDDVIDDVEVVFEFTSVEEATNYCNLLRLANDEQEVQCNDKTVVFNDYHYLIPTDKIFSKSELLDFLNDEGYLCK